MKLTVNGRPREVADGATVSDLVRDLGLTLRTVAVERNGEPVLREDYDHIRLEEDDVVEVVRPVQGGSQ